MSAFIAKNIFTGFITNMKIASDNNFQYISFSGYKEAMAYAKHTKFYNKFINRKLYNCNLNKLEGIQEGLKTFEGLSMKQIAFALTDLHSINMIRGCINHCLHCYANAQPFMSRAPFESFKQIMEDIAALRKRIGINPVSHRGQKYIDCYFDSDGMDMHLFDKQGNKHDAVELGRLIHETTGMRAVFDTNGWDRNNKEKQQIAEDYVKKLSEDKNSKHFYQINISLNPFNPKYVRALKDGYKPEAYSSLIPINEIMNPPKKSDKIKKAENDYGEYIKNEANTLFTFTPLVLKGKLGTIIRGVGKDIPNMEGCYLEDYSTTLSNILGELKLLYFSDLNLDKKIIKNKKTMDKALKKYFKLFNRNADFLFSSGRMEKFYKTKHHGSLHGIEDIDKGRDDSIRNFAKLILKEKTSAMNAAFLKMINSDGKVYMYDNYVIIPTDIKLNTGNKELKRPFWIEVKDFVVKTDMIDRI